MKLWVFLFCFLLAVPVWAQSTIVVPMRTDVATTLTPDFVRSCDYIARGTLRLKTAESETLGIFPYQQYTKLKGIPDFGILPFKLGDLAGWKDGDETLIFARYEGVSGHLVVMAKLPPTPINIACVQDLVARNPDFDISFTTDKMRYVSGENIKVTWRLKNVSRQPKRIYTGEFATQVSFEYDGMGMQKSDSVAAKRPWFTEVKAGESWVYEINFDGKFPVGNLRLNWQYESSDALNLRRALPKNVAFESKHDEVTVEIVPPDKAQMQQLDKALSSTRWDEQLAAAQKLLLTNDPIQLKKLAAFSSHPFRPLRNVASRAMSQNGEFSPALKALFYSGTDVESRKFRSQESDYSLALLAWAAVEEEAYKRGFKGSNYLALDKARLRRALPPTDDSRIGDLLAQRLRSGRPMAGGINNGMTLMYLTSVRATVIGEGDPLPDELQNRVLDAWKIKRLTVKNLYIQAQLNTEITLARHIRYDDFKVGSQYQMVAQLIESSANDSSSGLKRDEWQQKILSLPNESLPDLWRVLQWREILNPPPVVLQSLSRWKDPRVFDYLLRIAYDEGFPDGDARIEAIRLIAQLDWARAQTHIENFLTYPVEFGDWSRESPRLGAAIALAEHGDKRGVPIIFSPEYANRYGFLDEKTVGAALKTATGQEQPNLMQWKRWWQNDGVKMQWR